MMSFRRHGKRYYCHHIMYCILYKYGIAMNCYYYYYLCIWTHVSRQTRNANVARGKKDDDN